MAEIDRLASAADSFVEIAHEENDLAIALAHSCSPGSVIPTSATTCPSARPC